MSKLIHLRQRIKAIETIKKVTHAMRLIAMSSHSRFKREEPFITTYKDTVLEEFARIKPNAPQWQNPYLTPLLTTEHHELIILAGSQKGLCGNFNVNLLAHFEHYVAKNPHVKRSIVTIGKKVADAIAKQHLAVILHIPDMNAKNILKIGTTLTQLILTQEKPFTAVTVISNKLKNFFVQRPHTTPLIPITSAQADATARTQEEYLWQESPQDLLDALGKQTIEAHLQYLLFQSLLAEHAARFISMDSSTRNAQNLLDSAKLDYNKLRQAKITKELTELIGSFSQP